MNLRKGFTLIELLVVIAIIGLLSSVVLASLNGARQRGADTTIKGQLNALRSAAEIHYDTPANNSSYATFCASAPVTAALAAVRTAAGPSATATGVNASGAAGTVTCNSTASGWIVESPLRSNAANFWCVDSAGLSRQNAGTAIPTTATDTDC